MFPVLKETLDNALKPFDVVSCGDLAVGYVNEVSINRCQSHPESQISYSVTWLTGNIDKVAWFYHHELTLHCNLFVKIAEDTCSSHGGNSGEVGALLIPSRPNG